MKILKIEKKEIIETLLEEEIDSEIVSNIQHEIETSSSENEE